MNMPVLYCQKCGALNEVNAQFCRKCGAAQMGVSPQGTAASHPPTVQPPGPGVPPIAQAVVPPATYGTPVQPGVGVPGYLTPPPGAVTYFRGYAGFWIRFLAILIDGMVLGIPLSVMFLIMFAGTGMFAKLQSQVGQSEPDPTVMAGFMGLIFLFALVNLVLQWLYEAAMTSSSKQGTLGKMALGLRVVDKNGNRLSFLHATGRHFAKLINGFTMNIGYIVAGFTERKQGLHDMIAGTYVIKS